MTSELEYSSVSAAKIEKNDTSVGTSRTIRLVPAAGWTDQHFHRDLGTPTTTVLLQTQILARECFAVAVSPTPEYSQKGMYVACFGARGNTATILKFSGSETMPKQTVSVPSRVCRERAWTDCWVALVQGKLYAGVGSYPGTQQLLAVIDTTSNEATTTTISEQRDPPATENETLYIGIANLAKSNEYFPAFLRDRQPPTTLKARNLRLSAVPLAFQKQLQSMTTTAKDTVLFTDNDDDDTETRALMEQYQQECQKAKARAEKFGVPYKEPTPDAFLPWSQARRLRSNPQQGFITGLDLSDPNEKDKQEARKKRFLTVTRGNDEQNEADKESTTNTLPVEQAWDNESLVRKLRIDPPESLWNIPPTPDNSYKHDFSGPPVLNPEKIHLFSIDWAAFKQIRTNDIMSHFSEYGPTYVEWLGDLSCNVQFQDKFSAARALERMTVPIPSPPPLEDKQSSPIDLGGMGWRFGKTLLQKVSNDKYGRRGTRARVLMRVATSLDVLHDRPNAWPKPPPGFSTKRVLGPGSDFPTKKPTTNAKRSRQLDDPVPVKTVESMLSQGLSASRSGFTVDELEAERAMKRPKTSQERDVRNDPSNV